MSASVAVAREMLGKELLPPKRKRASSRKGKGAEEPESSEPARKRKVSEENDVGEEGDRVHVGRPRRAPRPKKPTPSLVDRALTDGIVVLDRPDVRTFEVVGSSKTRYFVTQDERQARLHCSCPYNAAKHRRCKHILYVLVRVYGYEPTPELVADLKLARPEMDQRAAASLSFLDARERPISVTAALSGVQGPRADKTRCTRCLAQWKVGEDAREICPCCGGQVHAFCAGFMRRLTGLSPCRVCGEPDPTVKPVLLDPVVPCRPSSRLIVEPEEDERI